MVKKLLFLILWLSASILFPTDLLAADEFDISFKNIYTITPDIETLVDIEVTLINKLANYYITDYSFLIGSTRISGAKAILGENKLPIQVSKTNNQTKIDIHFNQKIIGKDKKTIFVLSYKSLDFAGLNGQLMNVAIPQILTSGNFINYQTEVNVPLSFGLPTFISPKPESTFSNRNYNRFKFQDKQILNESIVALFGDHQLYDFDIKYHLANHNPHPVETEIALIPDTNHQVVLYDSIEPLPDDIYRDPDGNWLAVYLLAKSDNLEIRTKGKVKTTYQPNVLPTFNPVSAQYLTAQKYWPVNSPEIASFAAELKTFEDAYYKVVHQLKYSYERVLNSPQRKGAVWVINHPDQAICMEFTDLLITIGRYMRYPMREMNGYAYTDNLALRPLILDQDILHSWPQYYDEAKKAWVDVDPTWENTSGGIDYFNNHDLNRIAFVMHGVNSEYPLPAGAYKDENLSSKDIQITFGKDFNPVKKLSVKADDNSPKYTGMANKYLVKITNQGNTGIYNLHTTFKGENIDELEPVESNIDFLAPYTSETVVLKLKKHHALKKSISILKMSSLYFDHRSEIIFYPLYAILWKNHYLLGSAGLFIIIGILAKIKSYKRK